MEKSEESYWLGLSLLAYVGVMTGITWTLPRFERMYAEMLAGEPLPWLTVAFCGIPTLGYVAIMILGIVAGWIIHARIGSARSRQRLRMSVALFSLLLGVLYVIAVFSPCVRTGRLG